MQLRSSKRAREQVASKADDQSTLASMPTDNQPKKHKTCVSDTKTQLSSSAPSSSSSSSSSSAVVALPPTPALLATEASLAASVPLPTARKRSREDKEEVVATAETGAASTSKKAKKVQWDASATIEVPPSYTKQTAKTTRQEDKKLEGKTEAKKNVQWAETLEQVAPTPVLSEASSSSSSSSSHVQEPSPTLTVREPGVVVDTSVADLQVTARDISDTTRPAEETIAQELPEEARCAVIKFWNERLNGEEVVTKSAFLKALKLEVNVHPYILLFLTYTLCGREGIVNLLLAKAFFDCFGTGEVTLSDRVTRITSSLIHSATGAHGWFWGFLQQDDVDKVLKDAVHDGSFLLRVNHRKPGTLSLSYVTWFPIGCTASTVQRKRISTLRVQWDDEERGIVARFVNANRSSTWRKIGPYATVPHMLAYLSSAKTIGTSFPTSPLSWELRPARFNKKKDNDEKKQAVPDVTPAGDGKQEAAPAPEEPAPLPVAELVRPPLFGMGERNQTLGLPEAQTMITPAPLRSKQSK